MKRLFTSLLLAPSIIYSLLPATSSAQTPTFYEDVAPIMYDHCTHCHRAGDIASAFPFSGYNEIINSPAFSLITTYITSFQHPLWPPDTNYSHFSHEDVLTQAEKDSIAAWIANGAAEGNPFNAPPGPIYANESFIADPDMVLHMLQHYTIPGDGTGQYKLFVIPTGFTQERFVRAMEFRPQVAALIHHVQILVDTTGALAEEDSISPGYGLDVNAVAAINYSRLHTLYHPGDRVQLFPEGKGYRVPSHADLILQIHYFPQTTAVDDSAWVNIFFTDTNAVQEVHTIAIDENDLLEPTFIIPKDHVATLHHHLTICSDWSLLSISAQMNILGKSMKVFSVNPSNDTVPLLHIHSWLYNFRYLYYFPSLVQIDSNSNLFSEGVFDNTTNNPDNPNNPPQNWFHDSLAIDDDFKVYLQFTGSTDCLSTGIANVSGEFQSFSIQPNPTEDQATISFFLPKSEAVTLTVFDWSGRSCKTIFRNKDFAAGAHSLDIAMNDFPSGIYFCRLRTENFTTAKKLIIQR